MGPARWRARSLWAWPVGSVSLTFLGLTCITSIGVRLAISIDPVTMIVGAKATRST